MGWDWNRYYLSMWRAGMNKTDMRVGPLLGEQSSTVLPYIRQIDPALFAAICRSESPAGRRSLEILRRRR